MTVTSHRLNPVWGTMNFLFHIPASTESSIYLQSRIPGRGGLRRAGEGGRVPTYVSLASKGGNNASQKIR